MVDGLGFGLYELNPGVEFAGDALDLLVILILVGVGGVCEIGKNPELPPCRNDLVTHAIGFVKVLG
jgi:hypothetical protein